MTNLRFYFLKWRNSWKDANLLTTKRVCLHGKWLAGRARSTVLLQQNPSFGEMLDQVHFSCMRLCRKMAKYDDVLILWLTVLVYELFELPSWLIVLLLRKFLTPSDKITMYRGLLSHCMHFRAVIKKYC